MLARRKHPGGPEPARRSVRALRHRQFAAHQARRAARRRDAGRGLSRADRRAGRRSSILVEAGRATRRDRAARRSRSARGRSRSPPRLTDDEREAHRAFIATLGDKAIWREYRCAASVTTPPTVSASASRRGGCCGCCLRQPLLIERDEIDRIEQERREAAVAHRGGDDLAREREQQPRAFDHAPAAAACSCGTFWMRNTPAEGQLEGEQHRALAIRPCLRA